MPELIDVLVERSSSLKRELLDFSRKPRFDRAYRQEVRALRERTVVPGDEELANFADWFVQECRLHDGRTLVDVFIQARTDLPAAEREFLLGWRDVRRGIFEVVGRNGEVLITDNLIDDLPYRIRTNAGASIFDRMPTGSYLSARVVPVCGDWLISGTSKLYTADRRDHALAAAVTTATEHPGLVFRNPQRLARGWEMQRAQHATFLQHFGTDEITVKPGEAVGLMHGFWTAYAGKPIAAPPLDLDWLHDTVESIGIIYDGLSGLGMYADYALAQEAFADPDLMRDRRHKETIRAYITDDTVDPVPLQRLAARHPGNASRVIRIALGKPAFTWETDGEQLLRQNKKAWYDQLELPRLTIFGDRLAAYVRENQPV